MSEGRPIRTGRPLPVFAAARIVVMWWHIYYDRGSFASIDGTPFEAPRMGVIAIVQQDDRVGYQIVHSQDYFYWEQALGGWFCSDHFGMCDHLIRCPQPLVLFGRMISDKEYADLLMRLRTLYGDKQGWLQRERR